jgi:hypothetical protein
VIEVPSLGGDAEAMARVDFEESIEDYADTIVAADRNVPTAPLIAVSKPQETERYRPIYPIQLPSPEAIPEPESISPDTLSPFTISRVNTPLSENDLETTTSNLPPLHAETSSNTPNTSSNDSNTSPNTSANDSSNPPLPPEPSNARPRRMLTELGEPKVIGDMDTRTRRERPRRDAYVSILQELRDNPLSIQPFLAAFHSGLSLPRIQELSASTPRIHRSQLPESPKRWNDMLKHPFYREFMEAAKREYNTLTENGTWDIISKEEMNGERATPTMWLFNYKHDDDNYL